MSFHMSFTPAWKHGEGLAATIGPVARGLARGLPVLIVADPWWVRAGLTAQMVESLNAEGLAASVYSDFVGEPKLSHLDAALDLARSTRSGLVIGVGGGSALDLAKSTATLAKATDPAESYCGVVRGFPADRLAKIMIPTTAGTGSEFSATNIVALPSGRKSWIWGAETKPDLVVMDPVLAVSLPPDLTAWCGMDAFVHAFEAATSRNAHDGVALVAHPAMQRAARALPGAVARPDDLAARAEMLMASGLAGQAIDNCGTAIAHNLSHALAALAPVHHGLATALAFEITLPWLVAQGGPHLPGVAAALGLSGPAALPGFVRDLMDASGIERRLPDAFRTATRADLLREIAAPENAPMLNATFGDFAPVAEATADALLALAMQEK